MPLSGQTHRRGFLARLVGTAAALGVTGGGELAQAQPAGHDDWIKGVKGTHRCLFDFPQHNNLMPQLHILNYINTYNEAYKTTPGQVGAVGTFYSMGQQSSIPLAFNDAMWAKYGLGEYLNLKEFLRVIELGHGIQKPLDNVHLVVHWQLDRNPRQFLKGRPRFGDAMPVLQEEPDDDVPVQPKEGKADQNDEIGDGPDDGAHAFVHSGNSCAEADAKQARMMAGVENRSRGKSSTAKGLPKGN